MWAVSFGLTVDNTQFAHFREEIIKALGACIVPQLAQLFGLNPPSICANTLGGISVAARHLAVHLVPLTCNRAASAVSSTRGG